MLATNALTLVAEHFEALDMRHLAHAVKRLNIGLDLVFPVGDRRVQRGWRGLHLGQFHAGIVCRLRERKKAETRRALQCEALRLFTADGYEAALRDMGWSLWCLCVQFSSEGCARGARKASD
jgi:hypothetical protein